MTAKAKVKRDADKAPEAPAEVGDGREPQIASEEGSSFDERTRDTQPFMQDGEQVTGEGDSTEEDRLNG